MPNPADRASRQVAWFRWVIGVTVAVAVAVLISIYIQRDNLIAGCQRTSEFKVTEARAWEPASRQRRADGDIATAQVYALTARDIRATIPVAPRDRAVPRGEIAKNRLGGCRNAFPPPIPHVE